MIAQQWTLWGYWPTYVSTPIRLTGGSQTHCRRESATRTGEGWPELKAVKEGSPRPWFTYDVAAAIPIEQFKMGAHVGVACKYCPRPATTVYTAGQESMAFCDACRPGAK